MSTHRVIQPNGWQQPKGYANGIAARGELLVIAGQIGWDERCEFHSDELVPQFERALGNVAAVLSAAGARPEHLVRMTVYVTDIDAYRAGLREIGQAWRTHLGKVFPAMALVQVVALVEPRARVEIEATAVIPDQPATNE